MSYGASLEPSLQSSLLGALLKVRSEKLSLSLLVEQTPNRRLPDHLQGEEKAFAGVTGHIVRLISRSGFHDQTASDSLMNQLYFNFWFLRSNDTLPDCVS